MKDNALLLAHDLVGQGPPIVFIHGLTFDRRTWDPIVERLADRFRCLTVDLPGHGQTKAAMGLSVDQAVDRLVVLLDRLEIASPVLVGHSMGAIVAFRCAAQRAAAGVVVVDQSPNVAPFVASVHGAAPALRDPRTFGEAFAPFTASMGLDLLPESAADLARRTHRPDQALVLGYWDELLGEDAAVGVQASLDRTLQAITARVLAIFGRELGDADWARLDAIPTEWEVEVWEGRGHLPHLAEPDRFAQRVSDFSDGSHTGNTAATRALLAGVVGRVIDHRDLAAFDLYTDNPRVIASMTKFLIGFPDARAEIETLVADDDRAFCWLHITGTHRGDWRGIPPSGKTIDVRGALGIRSSRGLIDDFWICVDWLKVLVQLGAVHVGDHEPIGVPA